MYIYLQLTINIIKMKNLKQLVLVVTGLLFVSCGGNPNYEKNVATAQKLFALHGEENLDEQLALVSKDIKQGVKV